MIRINLLPYREKAKKENVRRQVSILAGVLVLFVLVLFAVHLYFTMSVSRLEAEVKAADTKLVALNKKVGDVEGISSSIARMSDFPGEARAMGERGRARMAEYDIGRVIRMHEDLFAEALSMRQA